MKLTEVDRGQLIELAKLEMDLRKVLNHHKKLSESDPAEEANKAFLEVSEKLSATRAEQEDLELENKRINEDLELVEARILRDQKLIQQSTNSGELSGLQHEMDTLSKRKGELETELIEKMEQQESVAAVIGQLTAEKQSLRENLEQVENVHQQQLIETNSELTSLQDKRKQLLSSLPGVIAEEYERKAKRGVPVGVLESGACSACHLNLTATDLAGIRATPVEDLVNCPECQAILIR
jgi:predicted  nucleic acid-binding Zn-ribbon protein